MFLEQAEGYGKSLGKSTGELFIYRQDFDSVQESLPPSRSTGPHERLLGPEVLKLSSKTGFPRGFNLVLEDITKEGNLIQVFIGMEREMSAGSEIQQGHVWVTSSREKPVQT